MVSRCPHDLITTHAERFFGSGVWPAGQQVPMEVTWLIAQHCGL
jgi:hypothetical protein